jgi:acyl-CoA thioesterase YciA
MNSYTDPAIRITLLPRDTNPQGTIFGGIILLHRHGGRSRSASPHGNRACRDRCDARSFSPTRFVGDLVSFYAEVTRTGTTSITVRVVVEAERHGGTESRIKVTEAEVVYVAVDENRRKIKIKRDDNHTAPVKD